MYNIWLVPSTFKEFGKDAKEGFIYLLQITLDGLLFVGTLSCHLLLEWVISLFHIDSPLIAVWAKACSWVYVIASFVVVVLKTNRDIGEIYRRYRH